MKKLSITILTVLLTVGSTMAQIKKVAKTLEDVASYAFDPRSDKDRKGDEAIKKKYKDAIVIDFLIPGSPQSYVDPTIKGYEEMAQMSIDGGFNSVSYSAAVDEVIDPTQIVTWLANGRKHWQANANRYFMVETADDIIQAKEEGKMGVFFNFQGSNPLGRNLNLVEIYYKLGVRQMNFSYNAPNFMSSGGAAPAAKDMGLTPLGKDLVREMNRVGMIVDCTHSSYNDCMDAAKISTKPIVLSHSNARGLYNIQRNAPDSVIKAVASTGGIIATNGLGVFLNEDGEATPERIAEHVNYIKELVGAQHTAFGSDYVHDPTSALKLILSNPKAFPPEMGYTTLAQMAFPQDIWGVVSVLEEKYKWTEVEVRGFLGENALRVYKANWK